MQLKNFIIDVNHFPKKDIVFKDITPLLADGAAFKATIVALQDIVAQLKPDVIVAPEARGFIFAAPVASNLGISFIPIRKSNKLPRKTVSKDYSLEYGNDVLQMHEDAIKPHARVVIIDDLLASGGTIKAIVNLVEQLQGKVVGAAFVIELSEFEVRKQFPELKIESLVKY